MAVLDSPWAVLEDCQRNKVGGKKMLMLGCCKVEKSTKRHFGPFSGTSWDQEEDLGLAIAVLGRYAFIEDCQNVWRKKKNIYF